MLFSSASYIIEYILYLFDNQKFEYKVLAHLGSKQEIDDVSIIFKFSEGLIVSSQLSMIVKTNNEANFYFDKAKVTVNKFWSSNKLEVLHHENNKKETLAFEEVSEMVYEINHIYQCLMDNLIQSPIMSEEITTTCVSLVEEIYHKTKE